MTNAQQILNTLTLSDLERDRFEERAAICEFCGKMNREQAEKQALKELWNNRKVKNEN